jgi:enamine deaminase RidA (YjgF/YER057c/UK114 family)
MGAEEQLKRLGIELPEPPPPVANYVATRRSGALLFVSGRKSELTGTVGAEVDESAAKEAARRTMITLLAIIKADIGDLDRIAAVVKVNGIVRSAPGFDRQAQVIDGASDLLVDVFGEAGKHARTATGAQPPFGATVQLELVLELHDP